MFSPYLMEKGEVSSLICEFLGFFRLFFGFYWEKVVYYLFIAKKLLKSIFWDLEVLISSSNSYSYSSSSYFYYCYGGDY